MIKKTVAIISPNRNAYSETFIQVSKQMPVDLLYYYGDTLPNSLENDEDFGKTTLLTKIFARLDRFTPGERSLINSFRKNNVSCILAHYSITGFRILAIAKYLAIPVIVHFHGYDAYSNWIIEKYADEFVDLFKYCHAVIGVSKHMVGQLRKMGCPPEKIHLITYGPDAAFFNIVPRFDNRNLITVGRFVNKKAPYLTILAFKEVLNHFPDAHLTMIGDGELLNVCEVLCKIYEIKNVRFQGVQSPKEIQRYMANSFAFLQHSVTASNGDAEGTPVGIIEAQAAGLPVVSTFHTGIPDVVLHGETGYLVKEFQIQEMAKFVIQLLSNPEKASIMGSKGKQRIRSQFSQEQYLTQLTFLVKTALSKN